MNSTQILEHILCPPGDGVFTVETAKEKKELIQKILFKGADPKTSWIESLKEVQKSKSTFFLGVPSDNGGGILRGANWGPLYLRERLLAEKVENLFDIGDVRVVPHLLHDSYLNQETIKKVRNALYDGEELPVSPLSITQEAVSTILELNPSAKIFSVGGDHSVSAALVPPFVKKYQNLGILHFDAHTDLLEERLGIDRCFATWAAHILPSLEDPKNLIQVGIRRSGKDKTHWENKFGLIQHWAQDILKFGAEKVGNEIVQQFKKQNVKQLYISFDIDAIDIAYASATGTPESDGLRPHDAVIILEKMRNEFEVVGADLVELAPFVNHYGSDSSLSPEPETTLDTATALSLKMLELMN